MRYIWMFHEWYDKQRHDHRFYMMLVLVLPIVTVNLWVNTPIKALVAFVYLVLILVPRMYRHYYMRKSDGG